MSELPHSAPGANPSARTQLVGAPAPSRTRSVTVVGSGILKLLSASGRPVSGRAAYDRALDNDRPDVGSARPRYDDADMLTVADAARLARRSQRTLRRAYLSGRLLAHRDGNGRGVRIRYGDLRAWLTAEVIAPAPAVSAVRAIARADGRRRAEGSLETGNAELLSAALRRRRRRARSDAAARPAERGAPARP